MKILLATDGSEFSRAAIKKCCQIAVKPENTEIRIISVFENIYVATEPFAVSAEYTQALEAAERKQAEDFTQQAAALFRECSPTAQFEVTTTVARGSADQAIIEEAEKWGADLIVVGSHGRGFWERMWLGSVSQAVIQHAPCSVLVVRKHK
jgi:nucleotide-binding universal stress UspA family protein